MKAQEATLDKDLTKEDLEITQVQENRTKQPVQNVETNAKYHSNQQKENQYIVEIVSERKDLQDTKN